MTTLDLHYANKILRWHHLIAAHFYFTISQSHARDSVGPHFTLLTPKVFLVLWAKKILPLPTHARVREPCIRAFSLFIRFFIHFLKLSLQTLSLSIICERGSVPFRAFESAILPLATGQKRKKNVREKNLSFLTFSGRVGDRRLY